MGKNARLRKQVQMKHLEEKRIKENEERLARMGPITACNGHVFRLPKNRFDDYHLSEYPKEHTIPKEFYNRANFYEKAITDYFFSGGKISEHGLTLKPGIDRPSFYLIMQCMLQSFEPSHEYKTAAAAWFLAECTTGGPAYGNDVGNT